MLRRTCLQTDDEVCQLVLCLLDLWVVAKRGCRLVQSEQSEVGSVQKVRNLPPAITNAAVLVR